MQNGASKSRTRATRLWFSQRLLALGICSHLLLLHPAWLRCSSWPWRSRSTSSRGSGTRASYPWWTVFFGEQCSSFTHSLRQTIWTWIDLRSEPLSHTFQLLPLISLVTYTTPNALPSAQSCILFKWTQMDTFPVQLLLCKRRWPSHRQTVVRLFVRQGGLYIHMFVCGVSCSSEDYFTAT